MDVFGNSSYIPDQAGWSQTGFMPSANSFTTTNTTNTWSQTPPSNIPWGISYSQALPNVIRFTGQSDMSFPHHTSISSSSSLPSSSIKRHLEDSDEDSSDTASPNVAKPPPTKQFITEEKMAAKMNEMHISHAFVAHAQDPTNLQYNASSSSTHGGSINSMYSTPSCSSFKLGGDEDMMENDGHASNNNNNDGGMPSLYLSEELKQLKASIEPLIPQSMLPRHVNSKALVLWTPNTRVAEFLHPSSPEVSDDEAEYIRSDDPACNVLITEIHEPQHRSEEEMAVDDV